MIAAFYLEIAVLVLGLVILLVDAFAEHIDKRSIAIAAMVGLGAVLLASFSLSPAPVVSPGITGFWSFYSADTLAIFFKRFALVTTIFVLIMMIDYAPIVRSTIHGVTAQAGLGYLIIFATARADTEVSMAAIVVLCICGLLLYGLVALAESVAKIGRAHV